MPIWLLTLKINKSTGLNDNSEGSDDSDDDIVELDLITSYKKPVVPKKEQMDQIKGLLFIDLSITL